MSDPFLLAESNAIAWCVSEGVSWAGLRCLRFATSQATSYRWDAARRCYVRSRVGEPDVDLEHDFVERALSSRPAGAPGPAVEALGPTSAPTPAVPTRARTAPARPVTAPADRSIRTEQLGLFGGDR